jgi:hypothetical protein
MRSRSRTLAEGRRRADEVNVNKKPAESRDSLLGLALLLMTLAWLGAVTLMSLAAFVTDAYGLVVVAACFAMAAVALNVFIFYRRRPGLPLDATKAQPRRIGTIPLLWAGAVVSTVLLIALPEGTVTPVLGVLLFTFIVAAQWQMKRQRQARR